MGQYRNPHSSSRSDRSGILPFEQIKHFRINRRSKLGGGLIFPRPEHNAPHFSTFKDCVEWAVKNKISLAGADLTDPYDGYALQNDQVILSGGVYDGGDFRDVMAQGVIWSNSSLVGADFSGSHTMEDIKKSGYSLYTTEAESSDFSGCNVTRVKYDKAILNFSKFGTVFNLDDKSTVVCILDGSSWTGAQIKACKFHRGIMNEEAQFNVIEAYGASFTEMDIRKASGFPTGSGATFSDSQVPMNLLSEQSQRRQAERRLVHK